eukprot:scaffold4691_cov132-Skeletonema_menzelii.AAC.1
MQANAGQELRRGNSMQLASDCNFPQDTTFIVLPSAISRGFDSDKSNICLGTYIRFPDGTLYSNDLGGAIAHAKFEYDCTDVNLVAFFRQLNGGQEALDYAANIGLPPGFVVARVYNDDGAFVRVNIYTEQGDYYNNYPQLAPLGINIATITCEYWQERLRIAVENHLPNDGWSASLKSDGKIFNIYSPRGDCFKNNLQNAWVTAGVIFRPQLLLEAMREFQRIVTSLNGRVPPRVFAALTEVSRNTVNNFLRKGTGKNETIYKINSIFGPNYDVNALSDAARDEGVLEQDLRSFELQMTTYMQRLSLRSREVPLPQPRVRAREQTNEYQWWTNANAPRVVVGLPPLPVQEAVAAEVPINQVGLPPLPVQEAVDEAINQVGLPPLPVQVQVQVDPPPQDADEESANFVAV